MNSSPEIEKQARNALSLLLNGSTSSWDDFRFIIYIHSLKLTAKVPEKMGETGIMIYDFPFLWLFSGEFAVSFRVSITVKRLSFREATVDTPQTTTTLGVIIGHHPQNTAHKKGVEMGPSKISIPSFALFDPPPK